MRALLFAALLLAAGRSSAATPGPEALAVRPGAYVLDPAHGKITFTADHLGFSSYVGQITGVAARLVIDPRAPEAAKLDATVQTATDATLNPALDAVIKSGGWLDPADYPEARFVADKLTVTGPRTALVEGTLTLRGVSRRLGIAVTFNAAGNDFADGIYTVGFSGRALLHRSEYGMGRLVPFIGDDVQLDFEGEFKPAGR